MQRMRFSVPAQPGERGTLVVAVPFDPDRAWTAKPYHPVSGTIDAHLVRGKLERTDDGWVFTVSAMWARDCAIAPGMTVEVDLAPEGPQRRDLAPDLASALDANPTAAAFFDTLAQFYTKAYLRWIDSTSRRPELRAQRIAEVVQLLEAGVKQRPSTGASRRGRSTIG